MKRGRSWSSGCRLPCGTPSTLCWWASASRYQLPPPPPAHHSTSLHLSRRLRAQVCSSERPSCHRCFPAHCLPLNPKPLAFIRSCLLYNVCPSASKSSAPPASPSKHKPSAPPSPGSPRRGGGYIVAEVEAVEGCKGKQTQHTAGAGGVFDKYARGGAALHSRVKTERQGSDDDFEEDVGRGRGSGSVRRKLQ